MYTKKPLLDDFQSCGPTKASLFRAKGLRLPGNARGEQLYEQPCELLRSKRTEETQGSSTIARLNQVRIVPFVRNGTQNTWL